MEIDGVDAVALGAWCAMWLGARPVEMTFSVRHLSSATGVVLDDGRYVVVKVRRAEARQQSCAYVQQHLWHAGFPCPEPLVGPVPFDAAGTLAANAEMIVDGGEMLPATTPGAVDAYAGLLARLIRLAPDAADVHFGAAPPWTAWDHGGPGVWPPADDMPDDLNAHPETAWLDDLGRSIQRRLAGLAGMPVVVGHGDFEAQNVRWEGLEPVAVHDWDSVIAAPEPVVVGLAAAVWPAGESGDASVGQTAAFIDAYQRASGRVWSPAEVGAAWAAGLWVRTFNAKKASIHGHATLTPREAAERSSLAGIPATTQI